MGGEPLALAIFTTSSSAAFFQMVLPPILAVADTDHGLRRLVAAARVERLARVSGENCPSAPGSGVICNSAKRRMRAALAGNDVRGLVRQDLVAGPAMHQRRRDVAHGARRQEHGSFLAEQIGDAFAELVHRGIVADLLVADLGARDRLAHRGRGAGLGVRQQVDADRRRLGIARGRGGSLTARHLPRVMAGSSRPSTSACG